MATKSSKDISNMLDSVMGAVDAAYALSEDDEVLLRSFARTAVQKTRSNSQVLLTTLTYVDRYFSNPPKLRFQDETTARYIHYKIFISALLTGHKYVSDMTAVANIAWVNVCEGKFSMAQINSMEWDFLSKINYGVVVEDEETQKRWLDTIQDLTEKADTYMMHGRCLEFMLVRVGIKKSHWKQLVKSDGIRKIKRFKHEQKLWSASLVFVKRGKFKKLTGEDKFASFKHQVGEIFGFEAGL
ncbi:hypothetical protein HDU80_006867 [Chytriomyces hyalinus]|nr:hypothetical protein HDU80_006867 [Chytriomyces hyalinus]